MKKLLAILLTLAMFATMIPVLTVGVSAEAPTYSESWDKHYDLSWITPVQSSSDNTVTVGDKYYQVTGYSAGTVFEIEDAADLAGLAYLVNAKTTNDQNKNYGTGCAFLNCTIKIVDDIDLSGYYWISIGKTFNNGFAGTLIGDNNGDAITISNMVINSTEASSDEPLRGLIGFKAGGGIENINLTNAYITTKGFRVGSFAGQFNNADIKNCTSDATIVTTAENTEKVWDACGGIIGCSWGGDDGIIIENCEFTGTIDSKGEIAGGIVGTTEKTTTIKNCTVDSALIQTACTGTQGGNNYGRLGVGGIAGIVRHGITAIDTNVKATIVCNNIDAANYAGALLGTLNYCTGTLTNCSFEGSVEAKHTRGFLGQGASGNFANQQKDWTLNLDNCTNNGTLEYDDIKTQLNFRKGTYTGGNVVKSLSAQKSTLEDVNAVRVVAQVKADALTGAGFDFVVSYNDGEQDVTTAINTMNVTKAFEKIMVNGTETAADDGYIWVAFVLNNIDVDSVTIYAVANATYTDSTIYGSAGSATIDLAA